VLLVRIIARFSIWSIGATMIDKTKQKKRGDKPASIILGAPRNSGLNGRFRCEILVSDHLSYGTVCESTGIRT
jgi:hypothetical protein